MYNGREFIYTLGIYDYRHRMYHPMLGQFMQVDPIGIKGDPENLYRYCMGNPIGHSDPTGTDYDKVQDVRNPNLWHIRIPINQLNGTEAQFAAVANAIHDRLSGTFGNIQLDTQVVRYRWWYVFTSHAYNTLEFCPRCQTEVKGGNRIIIGRSQWSPPDQAAHEGLHVVGRGDGFKRDSAGNAVFENGKPVPLPGYDADNLAVNPTGSINEADAHAIVNGNGKGHPFSQHAPTEDDARRSLDRFGSTTAAAAAWEHGWTYGGWLENERKLTRPAGKW